MRGSDPLGRFDIDFENESINRGMVTDLRGPVGTTVSWWVWDETYFEANPTSVVSSIYDTSNTTPGLGRMWKTSFEMPVVLGQQLRGSNVESERGMYVVDSLRLVLAVGDVIRLLPDLLVNPSTHIKDRVVFQSGVFEPTRVLPRGRYENFYSVITIDLVEINPEQLQNDSQFLTWAN